MPQDQRRRTELMARVLRDLDDPMFRLQLRIQEEAIAKEPQWVAWTRMRRRGTYDARPYGLSMWHRLASPVARPLGPGAAHMLETLCGRNVPGHAVSHITSTPYASARDGSITLCRTCLRLQPRRPGLT